MLPHYGLDGLNDKDGLRSIPIRERSDESIMLVSTCVVLVVRMTLGCHLPSMSIIFGIGRAR